MKFLRILLIFLGVSLVLITTGYIYYTQYYLPRLRDTLIFKTINEEVGIVVKYARTSDEWQRGLSGQPTPLPNREGLLFVFPQEAFQAFWMKDTLIPLDIIFINKDKHIVDITTLQPCPKDPCPIYTSRLPAQYVVEVNAGFTQRFGIITTDQIILPENTVINPY